MVCCTCFLIPEPPTVTITRTAKGREFHNDSTALSDEDLKTCEETMFPDYERFLVDIPINLPDNNTSFVIEIYGVNISCEVPDFVLYTSSKQTENGEACKVFHMCNMVNMVIHGYNVTCTMFCNCMTSSDCHLTLRMNRLFWRAYESKGKLCEIISV